MLVSYIIVFVLLCALVIGRVVFLHTNSIEIIHVSVAMFKKLQSIYEFRQDMQNNVILNSPKINSDNNVEGVILTIHKTTAEINYIKKIIKDFEKEISNDIRNAELKASGAVDKFI